MLNITALFSDGRLKKQPDKPQPIGLLFDYQAIVSDGHYSTRLKINVALVPPKPKLFDITAFSFFA